MMAAGSAGRGAAGGRVPGGAWAWAVAAVVLPGLAVACASMGGGRPEGMSEDAWITEQVRASLVRDSQVEAGKIEVETREGVVFLSGLQRTFEQVRRALERAAAVRGVRQVVNQIRVLEEPPPP